MRAKAKPKPVEPAAIGDRYRLEGTYERLRRALLDAPDDGRLDRALSYWVLPTDRRLPIAFLDRDLRELLSLPLGELMETQGVGQKKILGFFDLLRRAIKADSPRASFGLPGAQEKKPKKTKSAAESTAFDPTSVSEAVWTAWSNVVLRSGLGRQKLGRVAPTLRPLPTVIWHKTLDEYAGVPLAKIRGMKTHGEKRVNAILGVFNAVYEAVSTAALHEDLELDLLPRFVPEVNRWLLDANQRPETIKPRELHQHVVEPLVRQIALDLGDPIAKLVSQRLSVDKRPPTVKQQADRLSVTRARVYQLLEDCAKVFDVRWPEGRWLLKPLADQPAERDPDTMGLLHAVRSLFYPEERLTRLEALEE